MTSQPVICPEIWPVVARGVLDDNMAQRVIFVPAVKLSGNASQPVQRLCQTGPCVIYLAIVWQMLDHQNIIAASDDLGRWCGRSRHRAQHGCFDRNHRTLLRDDDAAVCQFDPCCAGNIPSGKALGCGDLLAGDCCNCCEEMGLLINHPWSGSATPEHLHQP